MRKVLQKNKLTYEEFQTVVIEIEGILNTRGLYATFMTIHPILLLHHRI